MTVHGHILGACIYDLSAQTVKGTAIRDMIGGTIKYYFTKRLMKEIDILGASN